MGAPFFCKFPPNDKNDAGYQHVPDQPEIILTELKKNCIYLQIKRVVQYILHTLYRYREKKTNPY